MTCYLCGKYAVLERHHLMGGANRKKSEKYNLVVHLCHECHRTGRNAVHQNAETMLALHRYGQRKWQDEQGKTAEDFRREFGKNYL